MHIPTFETARLQLRELREGEIDLDGIRRWSTGSQSMNSPMNVRLLVEPQPQTGAWNMALDEALLESAIHHGMCTVRIYRWAEPTVSLGYFQKPDEIAEDSPLAALMKVRRLSGGGAILHHHEWTYSCTVPAGHPAIRIPGRLYAMVHRALISVLEQYGVRAKLRGPASGGSDMASGLCEPAGESGASHDVRDPAANAPGSPDAGSPSPFLCFSRGDPNDVVLAGHKIVGSAQRRRKGAVLQHGSLLLRASEHAPHLPGIAELAENFRSMPDLGEQIGRAIGGAVGSELTTAEITNREHELADELLRTRYAELSRRH